MVDSITISSIRWPSFRTSLPVLSQVLKDLFVWLRRLLLSCKRYGIRIIRRLLDVFRRLILKPPRRKPGSHATPRPAPETPSSCGVYLSQAPSYSYVPPGYAPSFPVANTGEAIAMDTVPGPQGYTYAAVSVNDRYQTVPKPTPPSMPPPNSVPSNNAPPPPRKSVESETTLSNLYPIVSLDVKRYDRKICIEKRKSEDQVIVDAMTLNFDRRPAIPGWTRCVHPEGALYYWNEAKGTYTEANLDDPKVFALIDTSVNELLQFCDDHAILPVGRDLVLEINQENKLKCGYYFVHHETRTLFWVHTYDLAWDVQEVPGKLTPSHIQYIMESFYWKHMMYFPDGHSLSQAVFDEVKANLSWGMIDQATSSTFLIQYSKEDILNLLSLFEHIESLGSASYPTTVAIIARILCDLARQRFFNYHGEPGARLNVDQSVHDHAEPRLSLKMWLLSWCLFNAPLAQLHELRSVWTDELVQLLTWKSLVEKLKKDWEEYVLYSTVLLNANVAYLAIPDIITGSNHSTVGQVASYISILTSIGSVIVGLLLMRQYRLNPRDDARDAVNYLSSFALLPGGLEKLAVLHGVPYALLMWAMISFLVAICFECFDTTNIPTLVLCAVCLGLTILLLLWAMYSGRAEQGMERLKKKVPPWKEQKRVGVEQV